MRRAALLALAAAAALALPTSSLAATVGVEEPIAERPTTDPQQARLLFVGGAGEANRLTVSVAAEDGDFYDLRLVDGAAAIQPGPGCSGGGAAGAPVLCRVRKPTLGEHYTCFKGCYADPGTAWDLTLSFALGGAGSRLDTTALPASAPNKSEFTGPGAIEVSVTPGAGDDTVLTGPGPDEIGPSSGADLIRTGEGSDVLHAGPVADGPDDVDLGGGYEDAIDFSERTEGVSYDPDGQADDGAADEGDNLSAAARVRGGAGADTLVSDSGAALEYEATISGGFGDDFISGSDRGDNLSGGPGNDELVGGAGNDELKDPAYYGGEGRSGDDLAEGGPGDDEIELGEGDDEATGGPGRDRIVLGRGSDRGGGGSDDDVLLGEEGGDELEAGPGNDRLSGDGGRDRLLGGGGEDRIAAGMVVSESWEYRTFLNSPGPLEGLPDQVGCGPGRDVARTGVADAAAGCEAVLRAAPLEVRGFADGDRYFPPRIKFSLRRPGTARLEGRGLEPRTHTFRRDYGAFTFALRPVGRARQTLLRDGHVKLGLRISFRAVDGREVARVFAIDLWQSGELERREPARAARMLRACRARRSSWQS
ncbi:MAG TPA: calcium-binding protein [Solirubrobacterales bacterium]